MVQLKLAPTACIKHLKKTRDCEFEKIKCRDPFGIREPNSTRPCCSIMLAENSLNIHINLISWN